MKKIILIILIFALKIPDSFSYSLSFFPQQENKYFILKIDNNIFNHINSKNISPDVINNYGKYKKIKKNSTFLIEKSWYYSFGKIVTQIVFDYAGIFLGIIPAAMMLPIINQKDMNDESRDEWSGLSEMFIYTFSFGIPLGFAAGTSIASRLWNFDGPIWEVVIPMAIIGSIGVISAIADANKVSGACVNILLISVPVGLIYYNIKGNWLN